MVTLVAEDLIGTAEIAAMLGVSRQRADKITRDYEDFPAPRTRGRYRYWTRRSVERWIEKHPDRGPGTRHRRS